MGYLAYKGRKWRISASDVEDCKVGDTVTFDGLRGEVVVCCTDADGKSRQPYNPGQYIRSSNTIVKTNEYEISMTADDPPKITFTRGSGRLRRRDTGSWTADDNGPWPGEDEV